MNNEKQMTIHFNNDTRMDLAFPTQIKNSLAALMEGAKAILESDKLVLQTDEQVIIVPWSSVKFLEVTAVMATALPFGTIKGARIINTDPASQK